MDTRACDPSLEVDAKKKSVVAQERDRFKRVLFGAIQSGRDADDVVVRDAFGSNLDLSRRYGRAPSGERVVEAVPRTTPRNTTTIAALSTNGIGPALVVSGSVNRATFEVYIEHVLGPTLREGHVVVLDNASAHHGGRIAHLLAERGCRLCYLPPDSPDFSPIELAFSNVKACLRRLKARTGEALEAAIAQALASITAADARAFFAHCGYPLWQLPDQ
ncbi:MAG: transposase [Burkholderiales bacterium]|nr:transposase [Anaerolineae bacterium]